MVNNIYFCDRKYTRIKQVIASIKTVWKFTVIHSKCTFLVCFVNISGMFGEAMVHDLARHSQTKIRCPVAHGYAKWAWCAAKVMYWKGTIMMLPYPNWTLNLAISGQLLGVIGHQDNRQGIWLAYCKFGCGKNLKGSRSFYSK